MNAPLREELARRARASHACYDEALVRNPELKGRMQLLLRVAAGGRICSQKIVRTELADDAMANCLLVGFEGDPLPAPTGGCVDIIVPLNFLYRDAGTSDAAP